MRAICSLSAGTFIDGNNRGQICSSQPPGEFQVFAGARIEEGISVFGVSEVLDSGSSDF